MSKKRGATQTNKNPHPQGKGKKPPDGWRPIFRGAFAELSTHSWLQNFLIGLALLLIWPLIGATIMKSYRATIIGFGIGATFLIWIGVWILYRQASAGESQAPETELHGVLIHGSEPSPPNTCETRGSLPPEAVSLFFGSAVAWTTSFPMIVLQVGGLDLLTLKKAGDGLTVSAKIFSTDGRIVADLEDNEFQVNPNNYFKVKRPNRSTLIVYDQQNNAALSVRYLNPKAIRVSGVFVAPNHRPIVIDDVSVTPLFGKSTICVGQCKVAIQVP